jgi:hypothetical protein
VGWVARVVGAGESGPGSAVRGEFGDEELANIRQKHMGGEVVAYSQSDYMFNL